MVLFELAWNYLKWHYTLAIVNIFSIWGNFCWFLWNYFSIRQLARTLFTPWRRLAESADSVFDFFNYFSSILITLIMRVVGVLVRSAVILIGLATMALVTATGAIFLLAWILMPFILIMLLAVGVELGFKKF